MRYLLIAALLAVGVALVGVIQVVNVTTAESQVRIEIGPPIIVPYFYSPTYCDDCWYGEWNGRRGYHRGGGEPWRGDHREGDHRGGEQRGHGEQHDGHEGHGR